MNTQRTRRHYSVLRLGFNVLKRGYFIPLKHLWQSPLHPRSTSWLKWNSVDELYGNLRARPQRPSGSSISLKANNNPKSSTYLFASNASAHSGNIVDHCCPVKDKLKGLIPPQLVQLDYLENTVLIEGIRPWHIIIRSCHKY